MTSVANLPVFPRIWACFFCGVAGFFEDLRVGCFWACFVGNLLVFWTCFLLISVVGIAFFFNFYGTFSVLMYHQRQLGRFFVKICSFWA